MAKGKDFYGNDISEVIDQACRDLGVSREDLDIEVIETGSAGIFGLCKKKAHIRVQRKVASSGEQSEQVEPAHHSAREAEEKVAEQVVLAPSAPQVVGSREEEDAAVQVVAVDDEGERQVEKSESVDEEQEAEVEVEDFEDEAPLEPPSEENIAAIKEDLSRLLTLMGLPSEVQVVFEQNAVQCNITGPYEEHLVGPEGRILDSLQYLLRKMVSRHLPDKIMLALNAGDFRERRAEELKVRAVELAELVKADGKTQAIPALNPSERRVVHMILQEDKGVRSRSVGEGLFKKVLIYKPGKGRRPVSRKRRGGQGGRPSGD
jgi:spoIIIJ-associated protein